MFRLLILLLALMLVPLSGTAEEAPAFADNLIGVYTWPEGSSEADASYVYRYTYPQLAGDSSLAMAFNYVYQYEASDALGFECPMTASDRPADAEQMQVTISYEIVHQSEDYLSIRIDKTVVVGESVSRIVKGHTYALANHESNTITSLPYLLELLDADETDEWYIERQTAKADDCVREMVWALIEKDMKAEGSLIYEDMTYEEFESGFYPEEDFFLDAEGNFVFFIQEYMIAPREAGQFFYTISMEDLLDEI